MLEIKLSLNYPCSEKERIRAKEKDWKRGRTNR